MQDFSLRENLSSHARPTVHRNIADPIYNAGWKPTDDGLKSESPKNHLQRRIDVPDELLCKLQELHRRRKEEWLQKGEKMPEWVFCSDDGNFMNEYNFRTRKFYPLFKKAKGEEKPLELRQIRLHDLRHSYASLMLQHGESVTYVKEQMGHHSIPVTGRPLRASDSRANRAAANRLEAHIMPTKQVAAATTA